MAKLEDYWDPEITLDPEETSARINEREVARVKRNLVIAQMVLAHPRRMGGDVTPDDLKKDKKLARRVTHIYEQMLPGWGATMNGYELSPELKREAAQMDWSAWIEEQVRLCDATLRYIATWSISADRDQTWARGALNRLEKESSWLARSLE